MTRKSDGLVMTPVATMRRNASAPTTDDEREQELLARVAARDRDAFHQLYHLYHRRLARFLMRLTHRHEIAEEIINDTLWVVWRKAADFRRGSLVSTWILGIAYRRGLKTLHRQHALAALTSDAPDAPTADESQPTHERRDWLERALAQLPVEQRMALELSYYLGYSCGEIAEIMGCPVNTVKTRMYHARQRMKALLELLER